MTHDTFSSNRKTYLSWEVHVYITMYLNPFLVLQIQGPALRTIANLAESEEMAKNLIKCGVTPKSTTLVISYYQVQLQSNLH